MAITHQCLLFGTPKPLSSSNPSTAKPTRQSAPKILTRKTAASPYRRAMTAEVILQKSVRYDRGGKPLEVVIPYEEFVDFIETNGLDLTDEEKDSIREAKADREAGRMEKFVSLEDLEKELGI
jgi:hypothetical protein